jgi:hypothetical protein
MAVSIPRTTSGTETCQPHDTSSHATSQPIEEVGLCPYVVVRNDAVHPAGHCQPQSELKLGNTPGVILQRKIGEFQRDRNQAIAGPRGYYRARQRTDGPVSLAVGA